MVYVARYRKRAALYRRELLTKFPRFPQIMGYLAATLATLIVLASVELFVSPVGFWTWAVGGMPVVTYCVHSTHQNWRKRRTDENHVLLIPSLESKALNDRNLTGIVLFERQDLTKLTCHRSNLRNANLIRTVMHRASFRDSDLSYANMTGATCTKARFFGTRLVNARFDNVNARTASYDDADLRYATFSQSNLERASFDGADLRYTSFVGADLTHATFDGADVRGANFSGATIDPDALATAVCSADTVVPSGCWSPAVVEPNFELQTLFRDTKRSASSFLLRPIMFAPVWAFAVVVMVVLAEHTETAAREVAAHSARDTGDRSGVAIARPVTSEQALREVGDRSASEGSDLGASVEEDFSAADSDTVGTTQDENQSTPVLGSGQENTPTANDSQPDSIDETEDSAKAEAAEQLAESSPSDAEPALQESVVEAPALSEEFALPEPATGAALGETDASTEQRGVKLVVESLGGSSTVGYESVIATGGPFVVDNQSSTFNLEATNGIVTVTVVPDDQGTVASCSIEVGDSGRNLSEGNPGQPITCVVDLGTSIPSG